MIGIFIPQPTPRLHFAVEYTFSVWNDIAYSIISNKEEFAAFDAAVKINYSNEFIPNTFQILPSSILFEQSIDANFKPEKGYINDRFVIFPQNSMLAFDVFAMAFWCLSRYEEYQLFNADKHGRFGISNSFFYKNSVHEIPVLDLALIYFFKKLNIEVNNDFKIQPTLDIDMGFMWCGKGFWRKSKAVLSRVFGNINQAIFISNYNQDPFYTLSVEKKLSEKYSLQFIYFFLCGKYSKYDKSINSKYLPLQNWMKFAADYHQIGIHPSYRSNYKKILIHEKKVLEKIIDTPIYKSRQHYIKLSFPASYTALINANITEDYSMGFADGIGFRAGTSKSFYWYNLETETRSNLKIFPFSIMDVCLKNCLKLNVDEAIIKCKEISKMLKENGLPFYFIFHNESISNHVLWLNWYRVFETCCES